MTGEPQSDPARASSRLDGWKDIARYLGRDPRTAQRWEREGLPVFRDGGKVAAYTADLDRWRASRVTGQPHVPAPQDSPGADLQATLTGNTASWVQRPRLLGAGVACVMLLAAALAWQYWPMEPRLVACRQLTRDGHPKAGGLFAVGSRIYFNEYVDGKWGIASVPVTGGDVSYFSPPIAGAVVKGISPQRGSLLIQEGTTNHLFELQLGSGALRRIPLPADAGVATAAWDPSGRRIAVSAGDLLAVYEPGNASPPLQFRFPGVTEVAGWDKRGNRLRFTVLDTKTKASRWWEITGGDRSPHELPRISAALKAGHGIWTADERWFVFQAWMAERSQIRIASAAGKSPASYPLTVDALTWRDPALLPNSNTVLAVARQSQGQTVRLPVPGHPHSKPVIPGVPAYELDYSRDGAWITYARFPEHTLWRCRLDGSESRQLTPAGMEAHQPHWSPDGTRIAFMGKRAGSGARWRLYLVSNLGGSLEEPLPQGDDQGVPTWSPDGRSLIYGDLRTLAGFEGASIHELNLQSGSVSTISGSTGMWSPRMSPDGRRLAAVSYDNRSIYVRDNRRRTWRLCATMAFLEGLVWLPDSSLIQFSGIRTADSAPALFRMRPACEQPAQFADLAAYDLVDSWVGITPDRSAVGLVATPDEIYALDWRLRRRIY